MALITTLVPYAIAVHLHQLAKGANSSGSSCGELTNLPRRALNLGGSGAGRYAGWGAKLAGSRTRRPVGGVAEGSGPWEGVWVAGGRPGWGR